MVSSNLFSQELLYSDLSDSERPKGEFTSYVSKDGSVYKVGDRLKIGVPYSGKTFTFIQVVNVLLQVFPLDASASGDEAEIKSFIVQGTKRSGYSVLARCKASMAIANYNIQLENAIETGEIKIFGLTSDEALTELKKAKDKLELGLITQEKYDSLKIEFTKYIK
jgi:hypothetical protein